MSPIMIANRRLIIIPDFILNKTNFIESQADITATFILHNRLLRKLEKKK